MKLFVSGFNSKISRAVIDHRLGMGDEVLSTVTGRVVASAPSGVKLEKWLFGETPSSGLLTEIETCEAFIFSAFAQYPDLKPFHALDPSAVSCFIHDHVDAHLRLLHPIVTNRIKTGRPARLIFISSLSARQGTSHYAPYAVAKGALESLFLNLAVDYGASGLLSNIIQLGVFATDRNEDIQKRAFLQKRLSRIIPQGRLGEARDLVPIVDTLLHSDCYINGAVLPVSGGLPMTSTAGVLGT